MPEKDDLIKKLQSDIVKLERLHSEQVHKNHTHVIEQERFEMELLQKERLILRQSKDISKLKTLNKELLYKFDHEASFNKSNETLIESKRDEIKKLKSEHRSEIQDTIKKYEGIIVDLESEIQANLSINADLSSRLESLTSALDLLQKHVQLTITNAEKSSSTEKETGNDSLMDDLSDDEAVSYKVLTTDNEVEYSKDPRSSHSEALLEKGFEVKSLKKEISQLYDYINLLLKNQSTKSSKIVLKEKLVKRGILRISSINRDPVQPLFHQMKDSDHRRKTYYNSRSISLNISEPAKSDHKYSLPHDMRSLILLKDDDTMNSQSYDQNSDEEFYEEVYVQNSDPVITYGDSLGLLSFEKFPNPIDLMLWALKLSEQRRLVNIVDELQID